MTIAKELVNKFLLINSERDYILTDFPLGYRLYCHKKGTRVGHDDVRHDFYIYGAGYKFRSANEALFHFAWLMRGMPKRRCICVYDTPITAHKRRQGALNRQYKRAWDAVLQDRHKQHVAAYQASVKDKAPREPSPPTLNVFNDACFLLPE